MKNVRIVDSHTAGEPTRVVIEGGNLTGLIHELHGQERRLHQKMRRRQFSGNCPVWGDLCDSLL